MDIQDESLRIRISGYSTDNIRQHSTLQSIGLHLLPGAIATAVYVLLVPFATAFGYPSITLFYLPMILTVILLELGYLLIQGQKRNSDLSLEGIVNLREPVPWWQYLIFPILLVIWGIIVTGLVSPLDNLFLAKVFAKLPDWYALRNLFELPQTYPRETLLFTAVSAVILHGIIAPSSKSFTFADTSCRVFHDLGTGRLSST